MARRWKCSVCGYIHEGEQPPDSCPVCGAERDRFVLLGEKEDNLLRSLVATFRLHPVAAHFPNGLVPTAAVFLLLYFIVGTAGLETTAFWLVMAATMVIPISMGSGLYDWQTRFGGRLDSIFFKKIGLAVTVLALGLVALSLRYGSPELIAVGGWQRVLYLLSLLGMLGGVVLLGHYGTILAAQAVFARRAKSSAGSGSLSQDWIEGIVAQAPEAILVADTSGVIRLWNRGAEQIFGIPAGAAIGQSLDLIIPESLRKRHWEGWGKVMRSGESRYGQQLLKVPAIRGDGSRFSSEFSIVMLKDEAGQLSGVAAILRDVSEQWEREKSLREELNACWQKERGG